MPRCTLSKSILLVVLLIPFCAGCTQTFDGANQTDATELTSRSLTVGQETVPADSKDEIIEFENMTEAQQKTFERALNEPDRTIRVPQGVDYEVWHDYQYVKYQNETYSVVVAVP